MRDERNPDEYAGRGGDSAAPIRPSEDDERRALLWLVDQRANGGPLERRYAATIIETLAYFEWASADAEIPDVHDDPSWSPESAARFGGDAPGHQHRRARDGAQA